MIDIKVGETQKQNTTTKATAELTYDEMIENLNQTRYYQNDHINILSKILFWTRIIGLFCAIKITTMIIKTILTIILGKEIINIINYLNIL